MSHRHAHPTRSSRSTGRSLRICLLLVAGLTTSMWVPSLQAADWPTYRHDNYRSGQSDELIDTEKLGLAWSWQSPHPPQPAWHGPAKWDAYNDIPRMNSMRNYDRVFHVTIAGKSLYFGSSADDAVRCLDTANGAERWRYTTEGAIRMPPTISAGKVYVGSDDGSAYCLSADKGQPHWKFNPAPEERRVINNGRMVSFWPVRTGITVDEGTAYFGGSLLPWKRSYLCALDAETGKPEGDGRFVKQYSESNSFEGPMLASDSMLILSQGRIAPLLLNRKTGEKQGRVDYHGTGCFVLLTRENQLYHGPGNRDGNFTASDVKTGARLATFPMGREMIVAGPTAYLLSTPTKNAINPQKKQDLILALNAEKKPLMTTQVNRKTLGTPTITAFDRESKRVKWRVGKQQYLTMVVAGDTIFAGTVGGVVAISAEDGDIVWRAPVEGGAFGIAVADGALFVSTDEGAIHCFRPGTQKAGPGETVADNSQRSIRSEITPPQTPTSSLAWGPYARFVGPDEAVVTWGTREKEPTQIVYEMIGRDDAVAKTYSQANPTKTHTATLSDLERLENYNFTITADETKNSFTLETFFNYSPAVSKEESPYEENAVTARSRKFAEKMLTQSKLQRGICVIVGVGDGSLAYELVRQSGLQVVCVDTDDAKIAAAREKLQQAGVYGVRVGVLKVDSLDKLPLPSHFANLVLSQQVLDNEPLDFGAVEVARLLRPLGGLAYIGGEGVGRAKLNEALLKDWLAEVPLEKNVVVESGGLWATIRKAAIVGAGEWSHQYGRADNSAYGGEMLSYVSNANELDVQWVGRPGPRYQPDRQGRKTGPLATHGRLFTQGLQRFIALDAYNGAILWAAELPDMARMNVPRDSSNWCADDDFVYLAMKDRCWKFDAQTGDLAHQFVVEAGSNSDWDYDWGYIASHRKHLIGSATKQGSAYTGYWGHGAWYDQPKGPESFKVCSDNLFAHDKASGEKAWQYDGGVIINSTITIGGERIYFVESRNDKVAAADSRRLGLPELWQDQFLVALDVNTGEKLYEQSLDTHDGESVFYMAYRATWPNKQRDEKLVIVASGAGEYEVTAYNAADGESVWSDRFEWPKGAHDHGKAMSRPAFVRDWLFVRPRAYHLRSGEVLPKSMPGGGCGTYACSWSHVFFRAANVVMWDARYEIPSSWSRLRPSCWLSTIPSSGMLLSPEAGGGCSCGKWMETSVGFMPRTAKAVEKR